MVKGPSLRELEISTRLFNCLRNHFSEVNVDDITFDMIRQLSPLGMMRIEPNFGWQSACELMDVIALEERKLGNG